MQGIRMESNKVDGGYQTETYHLDKGCPNDQNNITLMEGFNLPNGFQSLDAGCSKCPNPFKFRRKQKTQKYSRFSKKPKNLGRP